MLVAVASGYCVYIIVLAYRVTLMTSSLVDQFRTRSDW